MCQGSPQISGWVEPIDCFPEEPYWPRLGDLPADPCEEHSHRKSKEIIGIPEARNSHQDVEKIKIKYITKRDASSRVKKTKNEEGEPPGHGEERRNEKGKGDIRVVVKMNTWLNKGGREVTRACKESNTWRRRFYVGAVAKKVNKVMKMAAAAA